MTEPLAPLGEYIVGMIDYARSAEKILAAQRLVEPLLSAVSDLFDHDAELAPELGVAAQHLNEIHEALRRAFEFVDARHDALNAKTQAALGGTDEGGSL